MRGKQIKLPSVMMVKTYWFAFALIGFSIATLYLYRRVAFTIPIYADNTAALMEANDVLNGNVFLHGWHTSLITFYTTELPFYVVTMYIKGFNTSLLHDVPAVLFFLVLAISVWIAWKMKATNKLCAALIIFVLVGLPTQGYWWSLFAYNHVATLVFAILAVLLLTYVESHRTLRLYVSLTCVMTLGTIGDTFYLFICVIPIALVSIINIFLKKSRRHMMFVLAASLTSVVFAKIVLYLIHTFGGFASPSPQFQFATFTQTLANAKLAIECIQSLTGAYFWGVTLNSVQSGLIVLHIVGFVLIMTAFYHYTKMMFISFRTQSVIIAVLTMGMLINLSAFIFSTMPESDMSSQRYLLSFVVYGAILTSYRMRQYIPKSRSIKYAIAFVAVGYLTSFLMLARMPEPPSGYSELATWLSNHNLKYGYGAYQDSSSVTAFSNNQIKVRPIIPHGNQVVPFLWMSSDSWYSPTANSANRSFVIFDDTHSWDNLNLHAIENTFGTPIETYKIHINAPVKESGYTSGTNDFTILVWNKNIANMWH